ncbi:MAG TPA: zf-HC2 domain-containing protein [Gemmatimonadales bacterium]|nr:zf-HC2 domain-containing protein [Gemmatimonadales bacterium]
MTSDPTPAAPAASAAEDDLDCARALELLQDHLKQATGPELERRLRRHLEACRPCFQSAQFERNFVDLIAKAAHQCAPERVRARVLAALRDEPPPAHSGGAPAA